MLGSFSVSKWWNIFSSLIDVIYTRLYTPFVFILNYCLYWAKFIVCWTHNALILYLLHWTRMYWTYLEETEFYHKIITNYKWLLFCIWTFFGGIELFFNSTWRNLALEQNLGYLFHNKSAWEIILMAELQTKIFRIFFIFMCSCIHVHVYPW